MCAYKSFSISIVRNKLPHDDLERDVYNLTFKAHDDSVAVVRYYPFDDYIKIVENSACNRLNNHLLHRLTLENVKKQVIDAMTVKMTNMMRNDSSRELINSNMPDFYSFLELE